MATAYFWGGKTHFPLREKQVGFDQGKESFSEFLLENSVKNFCNNSLAVCEQYSQTAVNYQSQVFCKLHQVFDYQKMKKNQKSRNLTSFLISHLAWPDKPVKSVEKKLLVPSLNYQQRVYSNRNDLNSAELLTN